MPDYIDKRVWLIGAGNMAVEYAKVFAAMKIVPVVIGRGQESARVFQEKTGMGVVCGGIDAFLKTGPGKPDAVVVAVNVADLARTAARILEYCQPKILLEKPGAITSAEIGLLKSCKGTDRLFIAYNRRFFASTQAVRKMLEEDAGPVSCMFEFTEWAHRISPVIDRKNPEEMKHWLIANSSHVIDLAFFLVGFPKKLEATVAGSLPWHPSGAVFCGSGLTEQNATFAYHANWEAPGRWWVEVMSRKRRYRMCPMETVQVQNKGEISWSEIKLDDAVEKQFKPGLYEMISAFISDGACPALCTLDELTRHFSVFQKMANYQD
jgi:predicted dehydrogenase